MFTPEQKELCSSILNDVGSICNAPRFSPQRSFTVEAVISYIRRLVGFTQDEFVDSLSELQDDLNGHVLDTNDALTLVADYINACS